MCFMTEQGVEFKLSDVNLLYHKGAVTFPIVESHPHKWRLQFCCGKKKEQKIY